jgi:2-polyprenyl-3-methyl-5-hydroxy-6-metoxy-1,4-benzoquinol methylase
MHTNCIICQSSQLIDLKNYQKAYLCKCESCGHIFSKKKPTDDELEKHYEGYGRNDYLSPITIKRYNELLDKFEPYRKTNKLIDVGCGIGYFLEEAKKRGWEVYGTEYTDKAINICTEKGISIKKGVLNPVNYSSEMFDIITSFEVIEHINNPHIELSNFKSILRKGGLIYVTTPNFNSILRYRFKADYNIISYPEHLSYYTPKTLTNIFKRNDFEKIKTETTGFSLTRYKTSSGNSKQVFVSANSDDEKIRKRLESNWYFQLLKIVINKSLSFLGLGDHLKGWYIKR